MAKLLSCLKRAIVPISPANVAIVIQRYKRLLGNAMQSRDLGNQKLEAMIGCGVLNKMTALEMPISYRAA